EPSRSVQSFHFGHSTGFWFSLGAAPRPPPLGGAGVQLPQFFRFVTPRTLADDVLTGALHVRLFFDQRAASVEFGVVRKKVSAFLENRERKRGAAGSTRPFKRKAESGRPLSRSPFSHRSLWTRVGGWRD